MSIGENIRKYRRDKDIKAEEVFEKIGVSQSTYSKIENNRCKIDIEILINIAAALQVDVSVLLRAKQKNNYTDQDVLLKSLENKIELLKEQNSLLKQEIILLKKE
ncbi:helix-turn-helix domain-containing protein [Flavobacterium sp. KBS0721]|uniref:helix-turn-helix domain-containing protein n=1 Tax=Flavobacterium sp. KBS0721 TaxID=1179672 RepID=UPI00098EEBBC|nr:helix-turn-helix transcriptional regulator [Flavobacterium sp. KBS0721]QDW19720.1 helix-turn-helix transcriptional regulator [Flavobacterium sp. KBS0721]